MSHSKSWILKNKGIETFGKISSRVIAVMISKNLFYCWFGNGEYSTLQKECMASWKKYLPEYNVYRLDESNCDVNDPAVYRFYKRKQWAFVSDYFRLKALYEHGGIYLDVDVEVVRDLAPLLKNKAFVGYEDEGRLNTAVIGAEKGNEYVEACLKIMRKRAASKKQVLIAPEVATLAHREIEEKYGAKQNIVLTLPRVFFYPYNPYSKDPKFRVLMASRITSNTYTIHHWEKSWEFSFYQKLSRKITNLLCNPPRK